MTSCVANLNVIGVLKFNEAVYF